MKKDVMHGKAKTRLCQFILTIYNTILGRLKEKAFSPENTSKRRKNTQNTQYKMNVKDKLKKHKNKQRKKKFYDKPSKIASPKKAKTKKK